MDSGTGLEGLAIGQHEGHGLALCSVKSATECMFSPRTSARVRKVSRCGPATAVRVRRSRRETQGMVTP